MIKLTQSLIFCALVSLTGIANADQVTVNIVYPINGATYPIMDPSPVGIKSTYFTSSFSVTCAGGGHNVKWGFDGTAALGNSSFYDQTSVQFVHKLPAGSHVFWVKSDCGKNRVKFTIGK